MTRMTGPDCVVMCNLINTYIHTHMYMRSNTRVRPNGTTICINNIIVSDYSCSEEMNC